MTRIKYDYGGNSPAVVLTQSDVDQIKAKLKTINVGEFAKSLGLQRTHIYALIGQPRIELLRFAQICKALNLQLLSQKDIDEFLMSIKARIS